MAELSRIKKYKDLRESIAQDLDSNDVTTTKELSRFQKRLNQIDANNFHRSGDYTESASEGIHRRVSAPITKVEPVKPVISEPVTAFEHEEPAPTLADFEAGAFTTVNDLAGYDNDYLDQYIREVKQYNIEQGNSSLENTSMDILRKIKGDTAASKKIQEARKTPVKKPYSNSTGTTDIPFMSSNKQRTSQPARPVVPSQQDNLFDVPYTGDNNHMNDPMSLTKEDIMAEVKNLMNEKRSNPQNSLPEIPAFTPRVSHMDSRDYMSQNTTSFPPLDNTAQFGDAFADLMNPQEPRNEASVNQHSDSDDAFAMFPKKTENYESTNQRLLNETTQMRIQLDNYEANLTDVNEKMQYTNHVLNIVVVVLILLLLILLLLAIYGIVMNSGRA